MTNTMNLQPDAYTRFQTVIHMLKKILSQEQKETYRILDVGGSSGFLDKFLERAGISYELTIIDPLPRPKDLAKSVRYIQAGGETLGSFGESFDVSIAIDVLEHLPGEKLKNDIVSAMVSVTTMGLIVVGPFETDRTDTYEHQLNDINKLLFGVDQSWLAEHFEYGKPNMDKIVDAIQNARQDLQITTAYTLPFDFWLESSFVNLMPYASYFLPKGRVEAVNATFNAHFSEDIESSFVSEGYRGIIVASPKEVKLNLNLEDDTTWPYTNQYVHLVAELLSASTKQTKALRQQNSELEHRLSSEAENNELRSRIHYLEAQIKQVSANLVQREKTIQKVKSTFPVNVLLIFQRVWRRIAQ